MSPLWISFGGLVLLSAGLWLLLRKGLRDGDQPDDVSLVSIRTLPGEDPSPEQPRARVTLDNPGPSAVLVSMSPSRARLPAWLMFGYRIRLATRTNRSRFVPTADAVVGVLQEGTVGQWDVALRSRHRRSQVQVLVGEPNQRLRVIRAAVSSSHDPLRGRMHGGADDPAVATLPFG